MTRDGLNTEEKESDVSSHLQISLSLQPQQLLPDVPLMNFSLIMELPLASHALQDRIVLILIEILLKFVFLDTTTMELLSDASHVQPCKAVLIGSTLSIVEQVNTQS